MPASERFDSAYRAAMAGMPPIGKAETAARAVGAAIGRVIVGAEYAVGVVLVGKLFGVL